MKIILHSFSPRLRKPELFKKYFSNARFIMMVIMIFVSQFADAQSDQCLGVYYQAIPPLQPDISLKPSLNTSCGRSSDIFSNFFVLKESFVPKNGQTRSATVTKKIKIRFVVLEADPTGPTKHNYRPADTPALKNYVNAINNSLANLQEPFHPAPNCATNPDSCYVSHSRLQVELTGIEFRQDPTLNYGVGSTGFLNYGRYQDSILNVYFVYNSSIGDATCGGWVNEFGNDFQGSNDNRIHCIVLRNYYSANVNLITGVGNIIHELAHTMGNLYHFDSEAGFIDPSSVYYPDYLSDIFGNGVTWNEFTDNNFMFGHTFQADSATYFSPMQLGRIHRMLFMGTSRKYAYPTEAPTVHPWQITTTQTWDFGIRMYQDIRVKPGATLTIKCMVQMPPDGRIVVEHGGKLIVDGGLLTSYHAKSQWKGIEAMGNMNQPSNPSYQGYVELKNGAIIERAKEGLWNFSLENGAQGGGIIKASNSHFYNCWRAVGLNGYGGQTYNTLTGSNCSFVHVNFTIDDQSPFVFHYGLDGADQFTSFDTRAGVLIQDCTFKNEILLSQQAQFKRGRAIHIAATGIKIYNTTFEGFTGGINSEGYTGTPLRNTIIYDNNFNHITNNITLAAEAYGDVRGNNITNMFNYQQVSSVRVGSGIYLDNTMGSYVGCNNTVDGVTDGGSWPTMGRVGIVVHNSSGAGATVMNNAFTNLSRGTQIQWHNPALSVFCNRYENNSLAWQVNAGSPQNYFFFKDQGTGCGVNEYRAGNVFVNNTRDIASYLDNQWKYYAYTGSGNTEQYPYSTSGNINLTNCTGTSVTDANSQCNKTWTCTRILNVTDLNTTRSRYTTLMATGQKASLEANTLRGHIIRGYNELNDMAGMRTFLETENNDNARKLLIPLYIEAAQYTSVSTTIAQLILPVREKQAYTSYYNIIMALKQQNRSLGALNASELQIIRNLAADSLEVSAFARAILDWSYNEPWGHKIEVEPLSIISAPISMPVAAIEQSKLYYAAPNPTNGLTLIRVFVNTNDALLKPALVIRNLAGIGVMNYTLREGDNLIETDTRSLPPGLYFYSLVANGKVRETKKLSVLK